MKFQILRAAFVGLVMSVSSFANAGLISFDDAYLSGSPLSTFYSTGQGVTITGTSVGVVGGNGNGDPGNWNLEGTNGSAFLGCHFSCTTALNFNSIYNNASLDIGMPGFNWAADFTVNILLNNVITGTQTFNLSSGPQNAGPWSSATFSGVDFNRIEILHNFSTTLAYGIDNISFSSTTVPEPSTLAIFALGMIGLASRRFKKQS